MGYATIVHTKKWTIHVIENQQLLPQSGLEMGDIPLIVDFPIKNGGSFHSYASLPKGIPWLNLIQIHSECTFDRSRWPGQTSKKRRLVRPAQAEEELAEERKWSGAGCLALVNQYIYIYMNITYDIYIYYKTSYKYMIIYYIYIYMTICFF